LTKSVNILNMYSNHTDQPPSRADIKMILERAGILPTQQRLEIALVIFSRPQHFSADQLLALVNRNGLGVSKATVYNTLGLFARKGIVREVIVDPHRVFYDSNTSEHHHLYNEDTSTLTDIYADCLLCEALPAIPEGTRLVGVDVVIRVRNADPPPC
jgi:Fur family iron response transcriptional regulator